MRIPILVAALLLPSLATAQVNIRVVDTGQALCTVTTMPGGHALIYDAGTAGACYDGIKEVLPEGSTITLLVLSHTDADHIGAARKILEAYDVRRVLRTGRGRKTQTWCKTDIAIAGEMEEYTFGPSEYEQALEYCLEHAEPANWLHLQPVGGRREINLAATELAPGATWRFGDAFLTFVTGHQDPPYPGLDDAEANNAGSIVLKLAYKGSSVLFTGDAVGRHKDQQEEDCIATEAEMLTIQNTWPIGLSLDSDVLVAPHHGGDNGSCKAFIEAVTPEWVIISAGRKHEHPDADAIKRFVDWGLSTDKILRTDRGDDEGGEEWSYLRVPGCKDKSGDDHIAITLHQDGTRTVGYEKPHDTSALKCKQ